MESQNTERKPYESPAVVYEAPLEVRGESAGAVAVGSVRNRELSQAGGVREAPLEARAGSPLGPLRLDPFGTGD